MRQIVGLNKYWLPPNISKRLIYALTFHLDIFPFVHSVFDLLFGEKIDTIKLCYPLCFQGKISIWLISC